MLRQAENTVKIVGILSEIDLKPLTFKKDGRDTEAISGVVYVKVKQMISGEFKELIIPVHCFSSKYIFIHLCWYNSIHNNTSLLSSLFSFGPGPFSSFFRSPTGSRTPPGLNDIHLMPWLTSVACGITNEFSCYC